MHNLALALHKQWHHVSGSDNVIYDPAQSKLKSAGILPWEDGRFADRIDDSIDLVILWMTAKEDNVEWLKAQSLWLEIVSFPDYIAWASANKTRVVVAWSHGKTTTTSMIMHVLQAQWIDFDYAVGSSLDWFDISVKLTDSAPVIIIEWDEYPASKIDREPKLWKYNHTIWILNGIEWDHMNVFPTFEKYVAAFDYFVNETKDDGMFYWNQEDTVVTDLMKEKDIPHTPYKALSYRIDDYGYVITHEWVEYSLQVFGHHFMINASAAKCACMHLWVSEEDFYKALSTFKGARNRLTKVIEDQEKVVYRDFAHAPSKLRATVEAVRSRYPEKQIHAFFELHTYSSLNPDFLHQYEWAFDAANNAYVFYTPQSSVNKWLPKLDGTLLKNVFWKNATVLENAVDLKNIVEWLDKKNTVFLFMSSGYFWDTHIEELFVD